MSIMLSRCRLSYGRWPWLIFPDDVRADIEQKLAEQLSELSDEDLASTLHHWTNATVTFDDLTKPLQDAYLREILNRHLPGPCFVFVLSR